jgi:superfamily I DNA/RNA helicase
VDNLDVSKIMDEAMAGDAVISRTNAPLVKLFFAFAKNGKRCVMLGKDYGAMLAHRIKGWKNAARKEGISFDGDELLTRNRAWFAERIEKLGEGKASQKERARDEMETVQALCGDLSVPMDTEKAVDEVLSRCFKMFSKDGAAKGAKDAVVLSSTHKFKGDERNRVFLLIETYNPGESKSGREGEAKEETNLLYVGITRAQNHLTYVTGVKSASNDEGSGGFGRPADVTPDDMGEGV